MILLFVLPAVLVLGVIAWALVAGGSQMERSCKVAWIDEHGRIIPTSSPLRRTGR